MARKSAIMRKNLVARNLMAKPAVLVKPGDTLRKAASKMIDKDLSQLPVQTGERYVGRVTDAMLCEQLHKAQGHEVATLKVRDLKALGREVRGDRIPPVGGSGSSCSRW